MKYILEFDSLEELLIAQAKVNATRKTEKMSYIQEAREFQEELIKHRKESEDIAHLLYSYAIARFLNKILKQEADIRKSMLL